MSLPDRVRSTIAKYTMIAEGQHVGVAVSGGADSLCLLHVLHELGYRLTVLHLNHGLRGAESDADEEFVIALAASLGLPVITARADLRGVDPNVEQAGRKARYRFFERVRREAELDVVATGHTASDQAETVLYRLLRGSGITGLSGIRPVNDFVVRPLIELKRPEIEAWLVERNIGWRIDSSNGSDEFVRNRIRREVLPRLAEEFNPSLVETLSRTAILAAEEESAWQAMVERAFASLFHFDGVGWVCAAEALYCEPKPIGRRLIRAVVQRLKGDLRRLDYGHVERLLALAAPETSSARVIAPGVDAFRSFDWVRFAPIREGTREDRNYEFAVQVPGSYPIPGQTRRITLEILELASDAAGQGYTGTSTTVDYGRIHDRLVVRNWYPGDHFARMNHSDIKVKQMFQQARIPIWERQGWPILTSGDRIVWARDFGPAAEFAIGPETTTILKVSETENVKEA